MSLPYLVDNLETVPEAIRPEYVPTDDGKFRLQVDGVESVDGLKSALHKERGLNKALKSFGKSTDEIAEILANAGNASDFEATLRQYESKWALEKTTLISERDAARASEREALSDAVLAAALTKGRATAEGHDLLNKQLGDRIRLDIVDGKRRVTIMDADGKTPMVGTGPDGAGTFDDLVKEATKRWPSLFEGIGGGTGAPAKGGNAPSRTITRRQFESLSPTEQSARVRAGIQVVDN
jgi:hypothetical protein